MMAKMGIGGRGAATQQRDTMLKQIFDYCDQDGDGMLTLEEFNRVEARVGKTQFAAMCSMGSDPNKVDFSVFKMQYDNGVELERDFETVQKASSSSLGKGSFRRKSTS